MKNLSKNQCNINFKKMLGYELVIYYITNQTISSIVSLANVYMILHMDQLTAHSSVICKYFQLWNVLYKVDYWAVFNFSKKNYEYGFGVDGYLKTWDISGWVSFGCLLGLTALCRISSSEGVKEEGAWTWHKYDIWFIWNFLPIVRQKLDNNILYKLRWLFYHPN